MQMCGEMGQRVQQVQRPRGRSLRSLSTAMSQWSEPSGPGVEKQGGKTESRGSGHGPDSGIPGDLTIIVTRSDLTVDGPSGQCAGSGREQGSSQEAIHNPRKEVMPVGPVWSKWRQKERG